MCGLAGFVTLEPGAPWTGALADHLLRGIAERGRDATGVLALTDGDGREPWLVKAPVSAERFTRERPALPRTVRAVIGHTRFATQGAPEWGWNNHPIRVGDAYLAHNGHVWNQGEVSALLPREPVQTVDSALLAGLVSAHGARGVLDVWHRVDGAAAVTYWDAREPDLLVLARVSSSPLYVWKGRKAIVWASTARAITTAWKGATNGAAPAIERVREMAEGEALLINLRTGETETRTFARPAPAPVTRFADSSRPAPAHDARGGSYAWIPGRKTATAKAVKQGKGKGKGKGKGAAAAAPAAPLRLAEGAACPLPPVRPAAPWTIDSSTETDGLCDGCQDYTRHLFVETYGGEPFSLCASCASWAERALR